MTVPSHCKGSLEVVRIVDVQIDLVLVVCERTYPIVILRFAEPAMLGVQLQHTKGIKERCSPVMRDEAVGKQVRFQPSYSTCSKRNL